MNTNKKQFTGISLFSGMGGDTLGMKNAGIHVVAYSEYMKTFRKTHDANFPECTLLGKDVHSDILKISNEEFESYKDVDFLFAGFPCQSFSTGGKRKMNDPRNTMFREFVRAAKYINAKVVIGENVKGLLTKKTETNELYIDVIVREFESLGYKVMYKVFSCHKYGIPQKRERLIIVGIKNEYLTSNKNNTVFRLEFPKETTPNSFQYNGMKEIVNFSMEGAMGISSDVYDLSTIPKECIVCDMENEEIENNPHPYMVMKRDKEDKSYQGKSFDTLFSFGKRDSPIHCEIVDIRNPCKTIICTYNNQPRLFIPLQNKNGYYVRMFTTNELKQIQTFPKEYIVCGNKKEQIIQCGNAVPPLLIERIIKTICSS